MLLQVVRSKHKVRAFVFSPASKRGGLAQLALSLANNTIEVGVAFKVFSILVFLQRSLQHRLCHCVHSVAPCSCCLPAEQARCQPATSRVVPHHIIAAQVWDVAEDTVTRGAVIAAAGHRSDVRAVALSSDDALLLSASSSAVKVPERVDGAPCSGTSTALVATGASRDSSNCAALHDSHSHLCKHGT
jgi:hypothetical protein